jgi:hypothetical protein
MATAEISNAFGCAGLISTLNSSGTITDGTKSNGERPLANQSFPSFIVVEPGGSASHVGAKHCN